MELANPNNMATVITKPKTKVDEEILLFLQPEEKRTTIVHCRIYTPFPTLARIWKTTYLLEKDGSKAQLMKAFNISLAPAWTWFDAKEGFLFFTLLFEGLSKECSSFQLIEEISEPGGFRSNEIQRNAIDVYETKLFY